MTDARVTPPLSVDDPRVSEWLDGRLAAAEAAEIARLVAASPELTQMVADLRRQKAALAALPASPPPAGFVRDVLAALDAAGDTADDDVEVEAEWRRIERERLEEEIAEAREDAAEPVDEPMRHRWPWLALAGALAAGVLAAIVINRPGGLIDREVAIVAPQQREQSEAKRDAAEARRGEKAAAQDTWLEESAAASDPRTVAADKVPGLAAGAPGTSAAERPTLERGRAPMEQLRLAPPAAPAASAAAQAPGAGGGGGGKEPHVRSVTYRIRTAADRQRLESLLAASSRMTMDLANQKLLEKSKDAERLRREVATEDAANALEAPEAEWRRGVPGGSASERIAISGPADVMARLAAALEASPATEAEDPQAKAYKGLDGVPGEPTGPSGAGEPEITLVIVVVDESGAAVQADEGRP